MTPILFVDHAAALGGAEQSLLLLMTHLDRQKWQPHLACVAGDLFSAAKAAGIPVHKIILPRLRRSPHFLQDWYQGARAVARVARTVDAHIIHSNTIRASLYAAWGARLSKRAFLWHMRDFWLSEAKPAYPWIDRIGKQLLCLQAARIIVNSAAVASHLPCQARIIHNGIDLTRFNPTEDGMKFRREMAIAPDTQLVGMIGRLRPWKGQLRFMRIAAQVKSRIPDIKFLLIGGSPFGVIDEYPQQVAQLCRELRLDNDVIFTGHLRDVVQPLAALDIFVHPGEPEPFGLVNVEAMAMGKPVVAFDHGALPEIVKHGQTGLLVPPEDESAMVANIIHLLQDKPLRQQFRMEARRRVEKHFTIQRVAAEIGAAWQEVLSFA